jgi:hypothetical protein
MDPRVIDLKEYGLLDGECAVELARLLARRAGSVTPMPPVTCVWLTGNRLTRVPDAVLAMTQLESLYLGRNHIAVVPRELGRLTRLTSLGLSNNPLGHLPTELANLKNLESLYLTNDSDIGACELSADLLTHQDRNPRGVYHWMEALQRHNASVDRCRHAVITLLACRRHASTDFMRGVPRELVLLMARHLWSSRHQRAVWMPEECSGDTYRPSHATLQQLAHRLATRLGGGADCDTYLEELQSFFGRL